MILILPAMTGGVILYLFRTKRLSRILFICMLAGVLAAAAAMIADQSVGSRQQITELPKESGVLQSTVPLTVETEDGTAEQVEIRIPEEKRSPEEIQSILEQKAAGLEGMILGKNQSLDRVEWNLDLPNFLENSAITVTWSSDRPEILSWEGRIGSAAEPEGSRVTLRATLMMEEETQVTNIEVTVYPSKEPEAIAQRLQEKGNELNEEQPGDTYRLPDELDGRELTWYQENEGTGEKICLLLLAAAGIAAVSAGQRKEEERKKRQKELLHEYPELLSKTHLLLAAGLSLRKVFERLAADYQREKKRTGKPQAAGEEILRTWYEMENGVLEQDAFAHLGERCGLPEYKSFALLLAQNQKKGGHLLPRLLEKEVQDAFEARKRRARIAGEKAAVKLALPMGMMLLVVLVIIMVPALLSF